MIKAHSAWLGCSQLCLTAEITGVLVISQNARGQDTCAGLATPSNILSSTFLSELNGVVQVCNEKQIFA